LSSAEKQSRADLVLDFVRVYIKQHTYAPCHREIGDALNISTSQVSLYLLRLEEEGFIVRTPGLARAISLTKKGVKGG
jgi:SOS-response transcriptional repressor LexA